MDGRRGILRFWDFGICDLGDDNIKVRVSAGGDYNQVFFFPGMGVRRKVSRAFLAAVGLILYYAPIKREVYI